MFLPGQIYTAGKYITLPPVVLVVTNISSFYACLFHLSFRSNLVVDEVTLLTRLGSLVGVRHILISYILLFLSLVNCIPGGQNNAVDSSGNHRSSQIADNVGAVFQEE